MAKKCLIIYASRTGNTEKVATRFKETCERNSWACDLFKIDRGTDINALPYYFEDYDLLCAGSPVHNLLAVEEMIGALKKAPRHYGERGSDLAKIVPGPVKGIVFATYVGIHLGPKEAEAALTWMEVVMEHERVRCIGRFSCPGKSTTRPSPEWYHGDVSKRPDENDLLNAERFLTSKLQEIGAQ
jgi:hypothetical protein